MKLRNKKTGEIKELKDIMSDMIDNHIVPTLIAIENEWEDYEEPKEYWFVDAAGEVQDTTYLTDNDKSSLRNFGNYFETKEEAEKAVEKLKAVKRLKDKGFKLNAVVDTFFCLDVFMKGEPYEAIKDDLRIVFGDEE